MIINLNDDWRLNYDGLQWIAQKRHHGAKAKRHEWENKAYLVTLMEATAWTAKRQLMSWPIEVGVSSLPALAGAIMDIREQVSKVIHIDKMHEQKGNDNAPSNGLLPQGEISGQEHLHK